MKFIKSAENPSQYIIDEIPEVCFIGRSNVGKSSLINALSNANIAKTSSTPGRTQLVNFFDFGKFRLVDLPGYGYAKLPKQKQQEITNIIKNYLTKSKNLKVIVQICDANVILEQDAKMSDYFKTLNKAHLIVLNKIDKQKMYHYKNNLPKVLEYFNIESNQVYMVSAKEKLNLKELNNAILKLI